MDSVQETMAKLVAFRDERDWEQFHTPRNLAAALSIEAAELQEVMLWKSDDEVREFLSGQEGRDELSDEIADVLIFALLFCHTTEIDPFDAIGRKLKKNAKKYPVDLARGTAAKYDELSN